MSSPLIDRLELDQFLKAARAEVELQALKLARVYEVDVHDILSRTGITIWKKWDDPIAGLGERERNNYVATVMVNHAKNLARKRKKDWATRIPSSGQESTDGGCAPHWVDPAMEVLFRDEQLRVYRAIARMKPGRPKDVMALYAIGFHSQEVQATLDMTQTNFRSQLSRARKELRVILGVEGPDPEGGRCE